MMSLAAVTRGSANRCELCRRDEALPQCRLCSACTDAIVRLITIRDRIREEYLSTAARATQADEYKVAARGFTPFWT
jgi:hypothetical protein